MISEPCGRDLARDWGARASGGNTSFRYRRLGMVLKVDRKRATWRKRAEASSGRDRRSLARRLLGALGIRRGVVRFRVFVRCGSGVARLALDVPDSVGIVPAKDGEKGMLDGSATFGG